MNNYLIKKSLFAASSFLIFGCNSDKSENKLPSPNILWITAEDIGPAFGCFGDEDATTPNIDQLAEKGIVYTNVYATAPICAPARSSLITGIHSTSLGSQHLRSEVRIPDFIKTLPELMREGGYYCTNNSKTDYNFDATGRWDENSNKAHWRNRPVGKPFFSVFNYGITHEGNSNSYNEDLLKSLDKRHDLEEVKLPPYYPNTPEMRSIWARIYDLITVFDQQVGEHVRQLKEDGLMDETIIFVFADHGFGMPRYKRWLYKTGLQVPLVVYVPEKYKTWFKENYQSTDDALISFIDFAPTVLDLANVEQPDKMQGISFISKNFDEREFIYGSRSRADDVYDVSRCITDGDYIYIHNFMPYKPYIQDAVIFSDRKRSFAELHRLRKIDSINNESKKFYAPKPVTELYDLKNDPHELNNISGNPEYADIEKKMAEALKSFILESRDVGFLHESEMMIRSVGTTPYEMAAADSTYNLPEILNAAYIVGDQDISNEKMESLLRDPDSGVRFWGVNAWMASKDRLKYNAEMLVPLLKDPSPAVAILSAEALIGFNQKNEEALHVLSSYLQDDRPKVVLDAAISLRRIGKAAKPLLPFIENDIQQYYGDKGAGYSDWLYPMFIGFALDQVLINCDSVKKREGIQ